MPALLPSHTFTLERWIDFLSPNRTLIVCDENEAPDSFERIEAALHSRFGVDRAWEAHLPKESRPTVDKINVSDVFSLDLDASYDLAICPLDWDQTPDWRDLIDILRRHCRTMVLVMPDRPTLSENGFSVDVVWREYGPMYAHAGEGSASLMIRGGARLSDLGTPRIWYIAPNRQIFGGVKILYNHVDILNSLGIPAVLATAEPVNCPAAWFSWNPMFLAFSGKARRLIGANDTVILPEVKYRDVRYYRRAARKLLFVQNPGLARDIGSWAALGYDGVLTLNLPDGRKSQMLEFLEDQCALPIFPISNHYSDDIWGKTSAQREAGRILCLPRKGPEFVERVAKSFPNVVLCDNLHQLRMAVEYAQSDVYVHTGFPEGQPMPPIEAMLSGCIVCGFTGKGGLDVMLDGRTAYVAPDGDGDRLIEAVKRALSHPNREQVRAAGQSLVRQFTRTATARELHKCYSEWLPALKGRSPSLFVAAAERWSALSPRSLLDFDE